MEKRILSVLLFAVAVFFCFPRDTPLRVPGHFAVSGPERVAAGEWIIQIRAEHLSQAEKILAQHHLFLKTPLMGSWVLASDRKHLNQRQLVRFKLIAPVNDARFHKVLFNHELRNAQWDDWADYRSRRHEAPTRNEPSASKVRLDLPLIYHANDRLYGEQWSLHAATRSNLAGIDAQDAWRLSTGNAQNIVAILDDGFFMNHDDLAGSSACVDRYLRGFDFNRLTRVLPTAVHGTGVLGIVGACSNNRVGISGVNWRSRILPVARGVTTSDAILALRFAIGDKIEAKGIVPNLTPAQILNLSFSDRGPEADLWREALALASQRDVIVVAASDRTAQVEEGLISVAAVDQNLVPYIDCRGQLADILAPGIDILSTSNAPNNYQRFSGASFAAPQVTGVVSLMRSVYPDLNWKSARWILQKTQRPVADTCPGALNASAAVALARDCALGKSPLCIKIHSHNLPNVPLLDLDKYVIDAETNMRSATVKLINRGGRAAEVTVHTTDPELIVTPRQVKIEPFTAVALRVSWPMDDMHRDAMVTFRSGETDAVTLKVHARQPRSH